LSTIDSGLEMGRGKRKEEGEKRVKRQGWVERGEMGSGKKDRWK